MLLPSGLLTVERDQLTFEIDILKPILASKEEFFIIMSSCSRVGSIYSFNEWNRFKNFGDDYHALGMPVLAIPLPVS